MKTSLFSSYLLQVHRLTSFEGPLSFNFSNNVRVSIKISSKIDECQITCKNGSGIDLRGDSAIDYLDVIDRQTTFGLPCAILQAAKQIMKES